MIPGKQIEAPRSEVGRSRPQRSVGSAACLSASGRSGWNERNGNRRMIRLAIGWLTMFVIGTDLFVVSPLLPLIAVDYQISPALAGLSVTVFSFTYMVSAPLLGHVADRIGRRRTLTCCLLAFAAANLATASAGSFVWLLAARLISGAAAAGVSPAIYALVGVAAPLDRRATWLALATSGLLVSLPLGAPIATLASVVEQLRRPRGPEPAARVGEPPHMAGRPPCRNDRGTRRLLDGIRYCPALGSDGHVERGALRYVYLSRSRAGLIGLLDRANR